MNAAENQPGCMKPFMDSFVASLASYPDAGV